MKKLLPSMLAVAVTALATFAIAPAHAQADKPKNWDKQDEAVDESFPASDASAKY